MNDDQLLRYSRQIMLPSVDIDGQERLLASTVLIVGLGGLGSPIALYLAAAGVGHFVLADHDAVDVSNLQRQIAHHTASVGKPKVESAAESIRALNPDTQITLLKERLAGDALMRAVEHVDLVLDGTDNFAARYAINDACFGAGKPLVSGAAIRMEGQVAVFDPRVGDSPCYRCLYPQADDAAPLNCSENGVAAPLVGIIGTVQAMEAWKLLIGTGTALVGHVLYFDALQMEWHKLRLRRNPACRIHG